MSKTAPDHIKELLGEKTVYEHLKELGCEEITKQVVEKIKEHYGIGGERRRLMDITCDKYDVAEILNRINEALEPIGYLATGFDNTNEFLTVMIERERE